MADGAIEQIKQKLDIVNEVGAVVALKRAGKAYKGLCPFHNERSPSFYVFPDTGTWRCFGCNEGGDIFTFVEKNQSLDFAEALALLGEKAGVSVGFGFDDEPHVPSAQAQARARLRAMNDSAAVWFHYQLLTAASASYARSYLQSRGISNESIEQFRLGYAPDGDELSRHLLEQGYSAAEIIEAGLARRRDADRGGGVYDYFRNRVIFTIRDTRDQTVGFGARELGGGHPKYLNTPQTVLFDKSSTLYALDQAREAARRQNEIVIVEGYMDAIMAHQYGYRNTVACIGSAITVKHVHQIKKLTRRLVLALDPDAAGEAATLRAIEVAQEGFDRVLVPVPLPSNKPSPSRQFTPGEGQRGKRRKDDAPPGMIKFEEQVDAEIRVLKLPDGIDPDEFISANPPAWEEALKQALPLVDFYFEALLSGIDIHSPQGKTEATHRLLPILASLGDRIKQDSYLRRLASLLRIDERDAQMELQRYRKQRATQPASPTIGTPSDHPTDSIGDKYHDPAGLPPRQKGKRSFLEERTSAVRTLEEHCLGLLLSNLGTIPEVCAILEPSDFWGTETRALYSILATAPRPITPVVLEALAAEWPPILAAEAERLRDQQLAQPRPERTQLARIAKQIAYRLKKLRLSEAITEITYLQREAAEQGDRDTVRALSEQFQRFTMQLLTINSANVLQT